MRVLYFSRTFTIHDARWLATYARRGYQTFFLPLEPTRAVALPDGVARLDLGGDDPVAGLRAILDDLVPALVHAGPIPSCGWIAARAAPRALLLASWGSDLLVDAMNNEGLRRKAAEAIAAADLVQCDSAAVRDVVRLSYGVPDAKIVQFPWGIDPRRFSPGPSDLALRDRAGWRDASIVLTSRAWEASYGFPTAIDAFRRARTRSPRLRLVVLGSGTMGKWLRSFISEHALEADVLVPGAATNDEVLAYLRSADAYLSCAPADGTSISLLEAMSVGLPVVVTDNRGDREWVAPADGGWLVPPGDVDGFAEALVHAVALGESARGAVAGRHRAVVLERADWERNVPILFSAIEAVAGHAAT